MSDTPPPTVAADQNSAIVEVGQSLYSKLPVKDGSVLAVASIFWDAAAIGSASTSIVIDGVESSNLDIPPSAIKRVYVNKNPFSAEFARPGRVAWK